MVSFSVLEESYIYGRNVVYYNRQLQSPFWPNNWRILLEASVKVAVGSPIYWSWGRNQAHLRETNVYSHGDGREKPLQQPPYKEYLQKALQRIRVCESENLGLALGSSPWPVSWPCHLPCWVCLLVKWRDPGFWPSLDKYCHDIAISCDPSFTLAALCLPCINPPRSFWSCSLCLLFMTRVLSNITLGLGSPINTWTHGSCLMKENVWMGCIWKLDGGILCSPRRPGCCIISCSVTVFWHWMSYKCHLGVVSHILYYLYLQRNTIVSDRCHLLEFLILWMLCNLLVILVFSFKLIYLGKLICSL